MIGFNASYPTIVGQRVPDPPAPPTPGVSFTMAAGDLLMAAVNVAANTSNASPYRYLAQERWHADQPNGGKAIYFNGIASYVAGVRSTAGTGNIITVLRAEFFKADGSITIPINHPTNGQPLSDTNRYDIASNEIAAFPYPAITEGKWLVGLWILLPSGGVAPYSAGDYSLRPNEALRSSATPFHTGARPANGTTVRVADHNETGFLAFLGEGRRKSVVVLGDSIEAQNGDALASGFDSSGPIRTAMIQPGGGGRCPVMSLAWSGTNLAPVTQTVTAPQENLLQFLDRVRIAAGSNCQIYTDLVTVHFRNQTGTSIAATRTLCQQAKALDSRTRIWGVTPVPVVAGPSIGGSEPALSYSSTVDQVAFAPQGTTERDAYMAAILPGGELITDGSLAGALDHRAATQAGMSGADARIWCAGTQIRPDALLRSAITSTASSIRLNQNLGKGVANAMVVNPGLAQQAKTSTRGTTGITDHGGGEFTHSSLSPTVSVANGTHALDSIVRAAATSDGTHSAIDGRMAQAVMDSGTKAALLASPIS